MSYDVIIFIKIIVPDVYDCDYLFSYLVISSTDSSSSPDEDKVEDE